MNKNPFFTIITPTYNRAYIIRDTIASVLRQTFGDFEYIIVDDGSIDDTEKVVESLSDPRIKYIKNKINSGGHFIPRNIGIEAARGDYVIMLDSDDKLDDNALLVFREWIKRKSSIKVFMLDAVDKDSKNKKANLILPKDGLELDFKYIICSPHIGDHLPCIKRSSLSVRFPENVKRNTNIFYDALARDCNFFCIPATGLYCSLASGDRITKNIKKDAEEWILGIDEYIRIFKADIERLCPKKMNQWLRSRGIMCILAGRRKEGVDSFLKALKYDFLSIKTWIYLVSASFFPRFIIKRND
ncbi:MAG: glycosyltransferase family 2 protein [Candidatus Pacebacteria bacterium]|nr:glycosyltransferase family 2 protein [Candidatus Paceibacterota bacterium]